VESSREIKLRIRDGRDGGHLVVADGDVEEQVKKFADQTPKVMEYGLGAQSLSSSRRLTFVVDHTFSPRSRKISQFSDRSRFVAVHRRAHFGLFEDPSTLA
jgi:hypothetical protein